MPILPLTHVFLFFIPLADERDAIQKKTFTKWINKHLKKVRRKFVFHDKYLATTVFLFIFLTVIIEIFSANLTTRLPLLHDFCLRRKHIVMHLLYPKFFVTEENFGCGISKKRNIFY